MLTLGQILHVRGEEILPGQESLENVDQTGRESLSGLMQFFGQKNKQLLATDISYWSQPCNVTHHEAWSALARAQTDQCRKEITSISCLNEQNGLFPEFIPK